MDGEATNWVMEAAIVAATPAFERSLAMGCRMREERTSKPEWMGLLRCRWRWRRRRRYLAGHYGSSNPSSVNGRDTSRRGAMAYQTRKCSEDMR